MRVPTHASYMNHLNRTLENKSMVDKYTFQSLTGLKNPNYSGYGMQAFNIVSMEASMNVVSNFLTNNDITNIEVKTMATALDAVHKDITNIKSMMLSFSGLVTSITPDHTGRELTFNNDTVGDYVGKTITIDGTQFTFANNGTGNNIDISTATNGEDVMAALHAKVSVSNPAIELDGRTLKFPLYTVNGTSSVLNLVGVETGEPHAMSQEQYRTMRELQMQAFSTMLIMSDSLNVNVNGQFLFGGGNSYDAPINFPFTTLDEFQAYYDGINVSYPQSASANLSNFSVDASDTGAITLEMNGNDYNTATITATNAGAFLKESITANSSTTGTLTFSQDTNTIRATENGAFRNYMAGDTIVIGGNVDPANAKMYTIKDVSADGKTIMLDEATPVVNDEVVVPNNDVTFSTSFPVGAVINMNGFGNVTAGNVQVTGVSADGKELYITVDPNHFPPQGSPVTVAPSSRWSMSSDSYYQGGKLSTEKRISENQVIVFDANGADPAFEKLFRALGMIAQGNVVDTRNPANEMAGTIDPASAGKLIQEALDMVYDGLFNAGKSSGQPNSDLYSVMAKNTSNQIVLNSTIENQTLVKKNLADSIDTVKHVDQTEAATKALLASTNLQASYAILQNAMSVSLLDYLK